MQIVLGDTVFNWTLEHARRRSLKLAIIEPTLIKVVAPLGYRPEQAETFIRSKADWVVSTARKLAAEAAAAARFAAEPGGMVPFMGKQYTLAVAYHPVRPSVRLDGSLLRVCLPPRLRGDQAAITQALLRWYGEQAKQLLAQKTLDWAKIIGVKPTAVTIRDQKTRWGSCSNRGSLNYNWRVICAPPPVIDYLVVHELCHMLEPNHSDRFWRHVETVLPDWKNSRRWLRQNGGVLMRLFIGNSD